MKRLSIALLLPSLALAEIQTATVFEPLGQKPTGLRGRDFVAVVEVVETERPPGGGVDPNDIGPVVEGTDYVIDETAGTIQAAPEREDFWARVVYQWDDAPTAQEEEAAGAAEDCAISKPVLKARITQDLEDMEQEAARADEVEVQMTAQIAAFDSDPALPASPTNAQLRSAVNTLAARDREVAVAMRDTAKGFHRSIERFEDIARLVACKEGIDLKDKPTPAPTPSPTPGTRE